MPYQRKIPRIIFALIISLLALTACSGKASVGYQPPLVPIKISIDSNGDLSVSWEGSYQTPIGTFSVGVSSNPVQLFPNANGVLTVRIDNKDTLYDLGGRNIEINLESGYYKQVSLRKEGKDWYFEVARIGAFLPTSAPTEAPVANFMKQETLTVSFQDGASAGISTAYKYYGTVLIVAEGEGQAAGAKWSDPFYIFTDENGQRTTPWHPTEFYNWTLWINGEPVDSFVESIPPYNSNHVYEFFINAPGGYLTFAIGDTAASDNNGYFTITTFIQ